MLRKVIKLVFEDVSLSRCIEDFDSFKCFERGHISIEDDHDSGCFFVMTTNDTFILFEKKLKSIDVKKVAKKLAYQLVLFVHFGGNKAYIIRLFLLASNYFYSG